jgi:hypothetical protein
MRHESSYSLGMCSLEEEKDDATCSTEEVTSLVTVVVIVCFATGCADPSFVLPTVTVLLSIAISHAYTQVHSNI